MRNPHPLQNEGLDAEEGHDINMNAGETRVK